MKILKWIWEHWSLVSAGLLAMFTCGRALTQTESHLVQLDDRVTWIEGTHPEATAAVSSKNALDNAMILGRLERIETNVAQANENTAWIRGHMGLAEH